jgi:hypothetical protein
MDATTVLLAEYNQLKAEQIHRIGVRDNLVYATLATVAAVVVGATQTGAALLLALPPACATLGWTFLANDQRISDIAQYLRHVLGPDLHTAARQPVLGWEQHLADNDRRPRRKQIQLAVDLTTFALPSLAAVLAYWAVGPWEPALLAVSAADVCMASFLAYLLVSYRERRD